jgi:hypothetical protein
MVAPLAVMAVVLPLQTAVLPDVVTFGNGVTLTATVIEALQPDALTVPVYVMLDAGAAVTVAPVVVVNAVDGVHA